MHLRLSMHNLLLHAPPPSTQKAKIYPDPRAGDRLLVPESVRGWFWAKIAEIRSSVIWVSRGGLGLDGITGAKFPWEV
jgi:hypothetical protein